jgi:hypothetical protein
MKITHKDLCKIYMAYINGRVASSLGSCPSPENLIRFFYSETPADFKTKIINHITECANCAQEFTLLLEMKRGAIIFDKELMNILCPNVTKQPKEKNLFKLMHMPKLIWNNLIVIIAIVFFSICLLAFLNILPKLNSDKAILRENSYTLIKILGPIGDRCAKSSLVFTWSKNDFVDYYILEIFDESFELIWRSQKLFENRCLVPPEMAKEWKSNKQYLWLVTGHTKTGSKIESPLTKFFLYN